MDSENYPFSPESEAASSAGNCSAGAPYAPSKSSRSAVKSSSTDKSTDCSPSFQSSKTCEPSTAISGMDTWTSSAAASLAKIFPAPEGGGASTLREADCGASSRELFVRFDPDSSSWKIALCLFEEDCPESSVTLPRQGMMRRGQIWELTTSEHRTKDSGCGCSPSTEKYPTPRTGGLCGGSGAFKALLNLKERGVITEEERRQLSNNRGKINPEWIEWLMGFPTRWTELRRSGTHKSHSAPPQHS